MKDGVFSVRTFNTPSVKNGKALQNDVFCKAFPF